jgi:hypothetical protein
MDSIESKIANLLLSGGELDQFQYQAARDHQSKYGGKFQRVVVDLGMVHEEKVVKLLSRVTGCPVVLLRNKRKDPAAVSALPALFCEQRTVYPAGVRENGTVLQLAMADPTDAKTRAEAQVKSGLRIKPVVATPSEIQEAILRDYGSDEPEEMPYVVGAIDLSLTEEEAAEEFKVTDMSGKTAVRHLGDASKDDRQEGTDRGPGFVPSPRLTARLELIRQNQEKGERIIRGLYRLCIEKGFFTPEEYQERIQEEED